MVHKSQPFGKDRALSFGGLCISPEARTSLDQVMPAVQLHTGYQKQPTVNLIRVHVNRAPSYSISLKPAEIRRVICHMCREMCSIN